MAGPTDKIESTAPPPYTNPDSTPFVYFDIVPAHGVMNGAIQLELAARVLTPTQDGEVRVEFFSTGHLRCSPTAAKFLRDTLDNALKMMDQAQESPVAASKLN
jgi:hypothetical protein